MVNMAVQTTPIFLATATLLFAGISASSTAQELPEPVAINFQCDGDSLVQTVVDGLQTDWEVGSDPTERVSQLVAGEYQFDWTGPVDASFKLWCRYTRHGIYFAVVGRDNLIVAPSGSDPGDTFEVLFEIDAPALEPEDRRFAVRVPLWNMEQGQVTPVWGPNSPLEGELDMARAEVAPREHGFFLEFNVPYIAAEALGVPFAPIRFVAAQRDWDGDANREQLAVVATAPYDREDPNTWGTLAFSGADSRIAEIAESRGVPDQAPFASLFANLGGTPSQDLALVLDNHLIVTGEDLGDFAWTAVLVSPNDSYTPVSIEAHDIDHDGIDEIFFRYLRERRSVDLDLTVTQELVAIYALRGEELVVLLEQEVANILDDGTRFDMEMILRERSDRTVVRFRRADGATMNRDAWIRLDTDSEISYQRALAPWDGLDVINWDLAANGRWVVLPPE